VGIEEAYNFRRIDDQVTTSGVVTAEQLRGLRAGGYDAVIDLLPIGHEHALPGEARLVEDQGLDYVHIPVAFDAPTRADFEAFARAMDAHRGQTIHLHCAANYRVSAFYSAYALRNGSFTDAEADALLAGLWDPSEHPAWRGLLADLRPR